MLKLGCCWIWASPFVMSDSVESMLSLRHPVGWDVGFYRGKGWGPARRHINACEKALEDGCDYLLILGADQVYEPDLLERLTARVDEGYETMCALVPTRGYVSDQNTKPFQPVAWRWKRTSGTLADVGVREFRGREFDGDMIEVIDPADGDVQRINGIGSGVMMFHRDHILSMPRPWFSEQVDYESQQRTASMDVRFAWNLQQIAGARLWVDCTIKVKHLHIFHIDDSFPDRFADWEKPGAGDPSICLYRKPRIETTINEEVAV